MCVAEHSVLYQYNIAGAGAHYMGLIQTETVGYSIPWLRATYTNDTLT